MAVHCKIDNQEKNILKRNEFEIVIIYNYCVELQI